MRTNEMTLLSVPASAIGTWTSVSSSGPACSPFGGASCSYVTLSFSAAVSAGRFVCAITGVTTSAAPAPPVTSVNYPMFLYDALGSEVAASYSSVPPLFSHFLNSETSYISLSSAGASLSGLSRLNFSPRSPVLLILTIRPRPVNSFSAEAFRNSLALFLSCSPLQVHSIVYQKPNVFADISSR